MDNIHEIIVLKMGLALLTVRTKNVQELGELLVQNNSDLLSEGGIWIWEYNTNDVYYSPIFCETLGFEYGHWGNTFDGFNQGNKEDFATGVDMINKLIEKGDNGCFVNKIRFTKKDGTEINILCTGTIFFKNGKPDIVLGTHGIL